MTPIIRTHRSRAFVVIDALITALGWLAFSYLATAGVIAVMTGLDHSFEFSLMGSEVPVTHALLLYVTIAALNALILILWGTYRRRSTRIAPQSSAASDDASLAERFALSGAQLQDIRLSRLLVIHHADDGEISRWEGYDASNIRLTA